MADDVRLDIKNLNQLIAAFKGKLPVAKVGILGSKNQRKDENTNASIGLKHEFGDAEVPQRSFLRMPLSLKMQEYVDKSELLSEDSIKEIIRTKKVSDLVEKIGLVGYTIVMDAFSSGGFGQWKAHAPGYTNNTGQILLDSTQLRNSIISEVEE